MSEHEHKTGAGYLAGCPGCQAALREMRRRPKVPRPTYTERFMTHVQIAPSGCWMWTAAVDRSGYGRVKFEGRMRLAHRVSYTIKNGTIPDALPLDHLCRVTRCVNPDHLEPVTQAENNARQLYRRGEARADTKLTEEAVREIRDLLSRGVPLAQIGRRYGVAATTIGAIRNGRTWKHVE